MSKAIFGVTPPSQDGFPIKGDFATCFVEKYLAPCIAQDVGTLPDGYLQSNPLPQVPTKQSALTSKIRLPPYLGLPIAIPTLRRIVGPAIVKAQIP
jgi:hypothetical protein